MKKVLLLFVLFVSFQGFSQKDSIVNYLGRKYEKISKEKAWYVQTIVKKDSLWLGSIYFSNGKLRSEGYFKKKNLKTRVGVFKKFNEKGNLKSVQKYNSKGKKEGVYLYFNDEGDQLTSGYFVKGEKEGVWKYSDDEKNRRARIVFKKGKVVDYKLWNAEGNVLKEKLVLSRKPQFKCGIKSFKTKLKKELFNDLKSEGLKTNFLVKFVVNDKGGVQNVSLMPEVEEKYKKKITNFFKSINIIEPAILVNRKVNYTMQIPFILH